jgi:large subunit ribosomal protein L21
MKYAVIRTGGKQYRVSNGDELEVEKLGTEEGKKIDFKEVLLLADKKKLDLGTPLVENAKVTGKVLSQFRGKKIRVARFRRRKRHNKVQGHRQYLTIVKITGISNGKN